MLPRLLAELRSRDVRLWADGDRLRCTAPAGVLTRELRDELHQRKTEIMEMLRAAEALATQQRAIVPLQSRGNRVPVFAVGGHNGDVFCYRSLAQQLGEDQPFFGLQPPGSDGEAGPLTRVEDLAKYFASQIRAFHPEGRAVIAGYCAGGAIAFELARQLRRDGAAIDFVALFACPYPTWYRVAPQLRHRLIERTKAVSRHARLLASRSLAESRLYVGEKLRERREARQLAASDPVLIRRARIEDATITAIRRYTPTHFEGRISMFIPSMKWLGGTAQRWRHVAAETAEYVAPDTSTMDRFLLDPHVTRVAEMFRRCSETVLRTRTSS